MLNKLLGLATSAFLLSFVACSDDNPLGAFAESPESSGTSFVSGEISSSSDELLSSGEMIGAPSNSGAQTTRYNLWDPAVDYKVNTGNDSTGFWQTFGDNLFGHQGESKVIFPVELEKSSTPLASVFKHCDGLCGSIQPDYLMFGPWAGVEIPLAKDGSTADVSSWGGICVTYESDYSIDVYLKVQVDGFDSNSTMMPFEAYPANYLSRTTLEESYAPTLYNLFKTEDVVTKCLKWSDFDVSNWAKNSSFPISKVYTGEEAAKEIQSIMFRIQSRGDDEKKVFNIRGLRTYDPSFSTNYWWRPDDKFYERFPVDDSLTCLWKGGWNATHVNTGFNDRDEYAGMVGPFDPFTGDAYAHIDFPMYPSMEYSPYMYESVIMECSGFCGTMDFHLEGSKYAVGGVGFSIAGFGDDEPNYEDIQDWGGVCVTYYSEKDAYLDFVVKDVAYENSPKVALPKSTELVERCFTWNEIAPNNPDMGKAVGAIRFAVKGTVDNEKIKFNFAAIGKYSANGACSIAKPVITPKSSSSVWIRSSSSIDTTKNRKLYSEEQCTLLTNLWSFVGNVFTGFGGTLNEKVGRWYKIEDDSDEHKSNFMQPLNEQELINREKFDNGGVEFPDSCGGAKRTGLYDGVCGTAEFKDDYFAGLGFYVAGFDHENGSLLSGDVDEKWGGICVTYASEADIDVVMNSSGVYDIQQLPKLPKVTLPKSSKAVTSCLPWNEFKSADGQSVDPKNLTTVNFIVYGEKGTQKKFNIHGLGKYATYAEYDYSLKCPIQEHFVP